MLLINASPNKDGNSMKLASKFLEKQDYQVLHLVDYQIHQYSQIGEQDEFFKVYELFAQADQVVFTSPIYWWTFSGLLKTFMDRIADVPYPPKELRKKKIYLLVQGSQPSDELPGLDYSFKRFCRNYGMNYQGMVVTNYELEDIENWELFTLQEKL
ncbi:Trp repressor binding protein [Streptococcus sp. DD10]|uniref:flavodoxin family protein n=1 Tax=Streptococcus sp. DD10 TaxID=1777878 RepID=UPI0007928BB4|nr:NAD(P)H-dependent oxidoreductase [Streptococcus sp. DD10]KXT74108.1 Trp repressor binding protein [Streptococcus sp. DD10]